MTETAYTIQDVLLLNADDHDATMEIAMSSNRGRLSVALPASLRWLVAIEWRTLEISTLMCSAEVRDASGARVAFGKVMSHEAPRSEVPLSRFSVRVTGAYTVHVYVDESWVSTLFVDVTASEG